MTDNTYARLSGYVLLFFAAPGTAPAERPRPNDG